MRKLFICCMAIFLVSACLCSCSDEPHEGDFTMPDGQGLLIVGLHSDAAVGNLTLYVFDSDGDGVLAKEYADPRTLASECNALDAGNYTVAVAANAAGLPQDATLASLAEWLKDNTDANPDLLTASAAATITAGETTRVLLRLESGAVGIDVGTLRLYLALPSPSLPDYAAESKTRAAASGYRLRCVVELCRAGAGEAMIRKAFNPTMETDSTFTVELTTLCGDYDLRLWTDYALADAPTADTYYNTADLKSASIVTEPYTANTDAKDAMYNTISGIALTRDGQALDARLQRPLAKYRIVATDVAEYRELHESDPEKYPPVDELTVAVQYEGFFPSRFNLDGNYVADAVTGLSFSVPLAGHDAADELTLCSDWVLAGADESAVTLTLSVTDSDGNEVCRVPGVQVPYRQNHMTTLRGDFLTAGRHAGGITVDTDWNDIIIEF